MPGVYVPRSPATGVLYGVVRTHVADFLTAVAARTDGQGLHNELESAKPTLPPRCSTGWTG